MIRETELVKPFYKTGDVATLVGLHVRTIQSYCDTGKLECVRAQSGLRLIPKDGLIRFLDSLGMLRPKGVRAIGTYRDTPVVDATAMHYYLDDEKSMIDLITSMLSDEIDVLEIPNVEDLGVFKDLVLLVGDEHKVKIINKETARG